MSDLLLCLCLSSMLIVCQTEGDNNKIKNGVAIKIVQEPASQSLFSNDNNFVTNEKVLVPKTKPSNFSGPYFLRSILGECYSSSHEKYRFDFCPFNNITQHETDKYWNPFKGIVGIWEEWKIENNTFVAMKFSNGDDCGEIDRNAYVYMTCGVKNEILNVTEPSKCQYNLIFATPLICSKDDLLVYPRMDAKLQGKWDQLESEMRHNLITKDGYDIWLKELLVEAGFLVHPEKKFTKVRPKVVETTTEHNNYTQATNLRNETEFQDLLQCNKEYQELYKELEELRIKSKKCSEE